MSLPSQHHSFDVLLAVKYGMESAIIIHHFQHWIRENRYHGRNLHEGRCWSYQSRKQILAKFPYMNENQVRRICENLVEWGVLVTGNFNKRAMDKTLWYAFVDEEEFGVSQEWIDRFYSKNVYERQNPQMHVAKSTNACGKIHKAIPNTKQDTKEDKKEREGASPQPPPSQDDFFTFGRVKILSSLRDKLIQDFGAEKVQKYIEKLDEFADINPKRFKAYANHATVLRKWMREDNEKTANAQSQYALPKKSIQHHGFLAPTQKSSKMKFDCNKPEGPDNNFEEFWKGACGLT